MANLILIDPEGNEQTLPLQGGTTRIGRDAENTIALDDPSVSTFHCEIIANEAGFTLKDLGSTNGSRVNGERITQSAITDGDLLRFGNVKARFAGDGVVAGAALADAGEAMDTTPSSDERQESAAASETPAPSRSSFESLPPGTAPGFGPAASEKDAERSLYIALAVLVGLAAVAALFLSFTM